MPPQPSPTAVNAPPLPVHGLATSAIALRTQPGAGVPAGTDATGVPVGAQLLGRAGDEPLLLSLAGQLERARPKPPAWPPLAGLTVGP